MLDRFIWKQVKTDTITILKTFNYQFLIKIKAGLQLPAFLLLNFNF